MEFSHVPVLLEECIQGLAIRPSGIYVDGTAGGAGHSREIAKRLGPQGRLIAIDKDPDAVAIAGERLREFPQATVVQNDFANIPLVLDELGIDRVDGILLDLGVSSHQLDTAERGFSYMADAPLDMSFSGLKTAVLNLAHNAAQKGETLDLPGLAASFAAAVSDTLVPRTMEAARRTGYGKVAVAGGVAANSRIRADLERACRASGHRLYLPALSLCGDNGAMIGCQAYYEYQAGRRGDLALNAYATRSIEQG